MSKSRPLGTPAWLRSLVPLRRAGSRLCSSKGFKSLETQKTAWDSTWGGSAAERSRARARQVQLSVSALYGVTAGGLDEIADCFVGSYADGAIWNGDSGRCDITVSSIALDVHPTHKDWLHVEQERERAPEVGERKQIAVK